MQSKIYQEAISLEIFKIISDASKSLGIDSYVIGGFVRD